MKKILMAMLKNKKQLGWVVILISVLTGLAGYWLYNLETSRITQQREDTLGAIAKLKASQIKDWYLDELKDAERIPKFNFLQAAVEDYIQKPLDDNKKAVLDIFNQIKTDHNYSDIVIASINGEIIFSTDDDIKSLEGIEKSTIITAQKRKNSQSTDLFESNDNGGQSTVISFISVVSGRKGFPAYAYVFRIDPDDYLYPLMRKWPIPSKTAETFIFRAEEDSIVYLSDLRHHEAGGISFKLPTNRIKLPSVKALTGYTGIVKGNDYRNENVLAYVTKIDGTPWYLVAKVDITEIFEEIPRITYVAIALVFVFILFIIFVTSTIYNQHQKVIYSDLYKKEKELWQQQEKFRVTMDSLGEGIITLNVNGKVQYMNTLAEKLTGWNEREARGRNLGEIYPVKNEETGKREHNILEKVLKHGIVKELANHTILLSKDGKEIPVMDTGAPIYETDGTIIGIVIAFQDETEKRIQQRKIKESEERLRSTLDNLLEGCQIIGPDYEYLYLNKTALLHSKYSKDDILGKTMIECYPGIENTEMYNMLKVCMKNRVPDRMENEFSYPDGSNRIFNLSFEPVPEGIFILSEDITEKRKAEKEIILSEQKYRNMFKNSPQPMWIYDLATLRFLEVNDAAVNHYGYSREEFLNMTLKDIRPAEDLAMLLDDVKATRNEYNYAGQWRHVKKNGEIIYVEIISHKVVFNNIEARHVMVNDITENKRLFEDLVLAKEKAEEMNKLKTNFLASMSHELRTPLVGINGFAEILTNELDNPEQVDMAKNIYQSGARLSETLNLILDLSKLESDKIEFDFDILDIAKETGKIVDTYKAAASKKGLSIKTRYSNTEIYLKTDKRAYNTILNNLINNAIKYTNEGRIITEIIEREDFIEIKVIDTGIGISEQYHGIIFDEFRQVSEGFSRNFEGTGLGLNITKKVVEKFGGEILLTSELGKGSAFTVKLPIKPFDKKQVDKNKAEEKGKVEKHNLTTATAGEKPTALLVDDDIDVFKLLTRFTVSIVKLEYTENSETVLDLITRKKYDLIFMDINLKRGMDGKQLTMEIRKIKEYEGTPIIAVTAYAMRGDKDEFLAAGCTHYLSKPFERQTVTEMLNGILTNKQK